MSTHAKNHQVMGVGGQPPSLRVTFRVLNPLPLFKHQIKSENFDHSFAFSFHI